MILRVTIPLGWNLSGIQIKQPVISRNTALLFRKPLLSLAMPYRLPSLTLTTR